MASEPLRGQIESAWNSVAGGESPLIGYTILNENVDDSGFLMAILDFPENHFNIDTDSVFFIGFSMGGFMSHKMAIEHGDIITAIASVSGTIGTAIIGQTPQFKVNVLHFQGTDDSRVRYEDTFFNNGIGYYSVGTGAEQTVEAWRN
ncbi:MAG: hypothetical protein WHW07_12115 [Bacteroidales bacterium]|jgi:polyhydroxybutyrate depolymerase|nr:hypothetical protein [Bacteroidales bacterium]HOL98298.1 hypothetical protein [Bacteroidales bacterium]HOM36638.1 hypothetical protein [Bacteroidales bacterium]HPD24069.1 hypothetical protein [Bacteroidales bacterium]HRT00066.1 hypothetical protein [Bacteroidales bacterium]